MIKFLDLKKINAQYDTELKQACNSVIDSGWYVLGENVERFETEFGQFCQASHAIGTGSGLDALKVILAGAKELGYLKVGDEVVIPSNTFIATALAVTDMGLKLVCADICPETFLLTRENLEQALTPNTKAVIAVHLYGQLCDMQSIKSFCDDKSLLLIEDAAQCHGAQDDNGHSPGFFSFAAAYSFFPGKNIGALGDGGAAVTNMQDLADVMKCLRNYGSHAKYEHKYKGMNSRLDEIQAAMLRIKLKHYSGELMHRRSIAKRYLAEIKNDLIKLPVVRCWQAHVWHLFVIEVKDRDRLKEYLYSAGIETLIHYPKLIQNQTAYAGQVTAEASMAERAEKRVLSIPIGSHLADDDFTKIIRVLNEFS